MTPEGAATFVGEIAELRPNSILLVTDRSLPFRSRANIRIHDASLDGEVVFAEGSRLAFTFPTTPEVFEAIEAIESESKAAPTIERAPDLLAAIDDALASYVTAELPIVPFDARPLPPSIHAGLLEASSPLEELGWCLTLLADRPLVVAASGALRTPVTMRVRDFEIELEATPVGAGWVGLRALDRDVVREAVGEMRDVFADLFDERPPTLEADGETVRCSERQVARLREENAVTVRSAPLPVGAVRRLVIVAPGQPDTPVEGTVAYVGNGQVGFTLRTPEAAPKREPMKFVGPLDAPRLIEGREDGYLHVLSKALAERGRWTITAEGDTGSVRLWVDDGRVVFTHATPTEDGDRIGERLVAARRVPRHVVAEALESAEPGTPIGAALLKDGRVSSADLNRALREQTVARAARPVAMTKGVLTISAWTEPPVEGNLLAVSPGGVRSAIVRRVAKDATTHELRDGMAPYGGGTVTIHLERLEPGFRLNEREMRVMTQAARDPVSLEALLRSRGLRPAESATLALLGRSLGFIDFERGAGTGDLSRPDTSTGDLERRVEQLEDGNHFDALEVHWAASHQEILAAYEQAKGRLSARTKLSTRGAALRSKLLDHVEEAFKVVGRRTSRQRYREELFSKDERRRAAEHLIEQAELAVLRSDVDGAELALDAAEELAQLPQIARLKHRCRSLREGAL